MLEYYETQGHATTLAFNKRITKEIMEKLRVIASRATRVVAWYPHGYDGTVRGPFGRWFTATGGDNGMGDPVKYPTPVAEIGDDVVFASAAMNSMVPLMDEVERLQAFARYAMENGDEKTREVAQKVLDGHDVRK